MGKGFYDVDINFILTCLAVFQCKKFGRHACYRVCNFVQHMQAHFRAQVLLE